ncbi:MAG: ParB/RepB/Spo0J family partition protein [Patescibacteria group bacterium]
MGLGRGLASLISGRDTEVSADDVLEQIDSMEFETDSVPAPVKPLVTMLRVDQEQDVEEENNDEDIEEVEPTPIAVESEEELEPESLEELPKEEEIVATPIVQEAMSKMEKIKGDAWDQHEDSVQHIALDDISINPLQPRRSFDPRELEDLQESIAQNGILQPRVVARLENGTYELIAGERRLRAARALRWDKVPCVVRRDVKSDQSRLVYALIENIQRENLNPIEEALAYNQLNKDFGLTHEEIGARMGKSRVGVTNIVRVLQLPQEIQRGLVEGKITMGHAKAILMIPDEEKQIRFYNHLVEEGLTVRKAEIRARRIQRAMNIDDPRRMVNRVKKDPLSLKYGPALEDRWGFHSSVRYEVDRHVFEVVFRATSEEELDQLTGRLLGKYELPGQDLEKDLVGE